MKYAFATPAGWSRSPFPPPQRGVYLRAPVATPSPEGASILLFDTVAANGTVEEQLVYIVRQACESVKILKASKPAPFRTAAFNGMVVAVHAQVPAPNAREEVRIFHLVDAGSERLPVAFIGGSASMPMHKAALDAVLASIGPLVLESELYTRWTE